MGADSRPSLSALWRPEVVVGQQVHPADVQGLQEAQHRLNIRIAAVDPCDKGHADVNVGAVALLNLDQVVQDEPVGMPGVLPVPGVVHQLDVVEEYVDLLQHPLKVLRSAAAGIDVDE